MYNALRKIILPAVYFFRHQKSYAQDGEDVSLAAFFENKKGYKGFFVDVGAHHPVRFSNTWYFYKKGWKGINIDPTPGSMKWFNRIRSRDINLEIGIGSESGSMTFYCFNEPALNTFDEQVAKSRDTGKPYFVIKKVPVPIKPLADVLSEYLPSGQTIDFLSVDVEGLDLEVLQSNDWTRFKPTFILVEDTSFNLMRPEQSDIFNFLQKQGYSLKIALKRTLIFHSNF